jgi:xanthine dehydrogenase small subunit
MVSLAEDAVLEGKAITEKRTKNYLTGNLCRCTGYDPIVRAALSINLGDIEVLQDRYHHAKVMKELKNLVKNPVEINAMEFQVFLPTTLNNETLDLHSSKYFK